MKPVWAYTIACTSAAVVTALLTWLVNDTGVEGAPIVSAVFGALLSAITIGNALRGSLRSNAGGRTPLSMRARWIWGLIGAVIIIAFALVMPPLYSWHLREFHDGR